MKVKSKYLLIAVFAIAAVIYLLCLRAYYVGFFNDDAFYLIGARSLLHGIYAQLNSPGAPPLIQYMPGYPLLLAPLLWLWPGTFLPCQLLSVVLSLGALALFWSFLWSHLDARARWASLILSAFNPLAVSLSGTILSDVPYLFLSALILLLAQSIWNSNKAAPWAGLCILCSCAFYIRPTGAAFPLALAAALALEKRRRLAIACAALSVLIIGLWLGRNIRAGGMPLTYAVEISEPYHANALASLACVFLKNAVFYSKEIFTRALWRWPQWPGSGALELGTILFGWTCVFLGMVRSPAQRFTRLYLTMYFLAHLAWGKQSGRYILPVLPLIIGYFFFGLSALEKRYGWIGGKAIPIALATGLLLCLGSVTKILDSSLRRHTALNTPPLRTFSWIATHTKASAIFCAELDGRLYLYTQRKTLRLPKAGSSQALWNWAKERGALYVLAFPTDYIMQTISNRGLSDPMALDQLNRLLSDSRFFHPVFSDTNEGSIIYLAN